MSRGGSGALRAVQIFCELLGAESRRLTSRLKSIRQKRLGEAAWAWVPRVNPVQRASIIRPKHSKGLLLFHEPRVA